MVSHRLFSKKKKPMPKHRPSLNNIFSHQIAYMTFCNTDMVLRRLYIRLEEYLLVPYRAFLPSTLLLHPDNMAAGPASYGMTDTLGRMHSDAQFAGSSSVPAHVEMMGLIGAGNNPMVGMTVAVAVSIEEAAKEGKF